MGYKEMSIKKGCGKCRALRHLISAEKMLIMAQTNLGFNSDIASNPDARLAEVQIAGVLEYIKAAKVAMTTK